MHFALNVLGLVAVVGFVAAASRRYGVSEPLALVVVGIGLSFVPGVLDIEITPDLVLFGLLPPLLYAAAIRTSLVDFRANRRSIVLLSVNLVIFSTAGVGLLSWWLIPGISGAAAFALGAVVAPPDAVAATTVARRVGMPRNIVSILEGESLVNDATALVALNTAIAAIMSSHIHAWTVGWDFARAAIGGVVIGLVAVVLLGKDPQVHLRPGAGHHVVVRGTVRRVPAGGGGPRVGRARGRGDRAAARARGAAAAIGGVADRGEHQLAHRAVPPRERRLPADRAADPLSDRRCPGRRPGLVDWIPACLAVLVATIVVRACGSSVFNGVYRLLGRSGVDVAGGDRRSSPGPACAAW